MTAMKRLLVLALGMAMPAWAWCASPSTVAGTTATPYDPTVSSASDTVTATPPPGKSIKATGSTAAAESGNPGTMRLEQPLGATSATWDGRAAPYGCLYRLTGVFTGGAGPGGLGVPPAWESTYNYTKSLRISLSVSPAVIASGQTAVATVSLLGGVDGASYTPSLTDETASSGKTPAGTVTITATNPPPVLTTKNRYAAWTVTGGTPGYRDIKATCTGVTNSPQKQEITVVGVELDSVTNCDFIGTDATGVRVYCTAKGTGDVVIKLKTNPSATLSPGSVSWTGGSDGGDQMTRKVSKAELIEAGQAVSATVGSAIVKVKVYVFKGAPTSASVVIDIPADGIRDDKVAAPDYGGTVRDVLVFKDEYGIYYGNAKWHFEFEKVGHSVKWGVNQGIVGDVPDPAANPFPLGANVDPNSTEQDKRRWAKLDLTPGGTGLPSRMRYWSKSISQKHELYHVHDWLQTYTAAMKEAETWIESQEVSVTVNNLDPADVLTVKKGDFAGKVMAKAMEANTTYLGPALTPAQIANGELREVDIRAYADGKAAYEALVKAIP